MGEVAGSIPARPLFFVLPFILFFFSELPCDPLGWSYSVMVITKDFESFDPGSSPGRTSSFNAHVTLAEWLWRLIRNQVGLPRTGSNPVGDVFLHVRSTKQVSCACGVVVIMYGSQPCDPGSIPGWRIPNDFGYR